MRSVEPKEGKAAPPAPRWRTDHRAASFILREQICHDHQAGRDRARRQRAPPVRVICVWLFKLVECVTLSRPLDSRCVAIHSPNVPTLPRHAKSLLARHAAEAAGKLLVKIDQGRLAGTAILRDRRIAKNQDTHSTLGPVRGDT